MVKINDDFTEQSIQIGVSYTESYILLYKMNCVIIGAGMAGLTAANEFKSKGYSVKVIDKGRGVGGRLATRRIGEAKLDHGAQYFSNKTPDFQNFTAELLNKGILKEWDIDGLSHKRMIGAEGMSNIAKYLAKDLEIITSERIIRITENQIISESEKIFEFDKLIFTIPAPQAIDLLNNSGLEVPQQLFKIEYQPCIAVLVVLNQESNLPKSGGLKLENHPISWIADNFVKGISPKYAVTIHASPEFSNEHLEQDMNEIGKKLLDLASEWIPAGSIESYQTHRWRYSLADKRAEEKFINLNENILIGGDGFGIGNVEGAFISGKAMAYTILS